MGDISQIDLCHPLIILRNIFGYLSISLCSYVGYLVHTVMDRVPEARECVSPRGCSSNLSAAKKCARHGYDVYMLPNPNGGKTPDFILEKNGKYYAYELKTIYSVASIITRLESAILQSDRIMLDMVATTNSRYLAEKICYFLRTHSEIKDIMLFKGEKELHASPQMAGKKSFIEDFMIRWDR